MDIEDRDSFARCNKDQKTASLVSLVSLVFAQDNSKAREARQLCFRFQMLVRPRAKESRRENVEGEPGSMVVQHV